MNLILINTFLFKIQKKLSGLFTMFIPVKFSLNLNTLSDMIESSFFCIYYMTEYYLPCFTYLPVLLACSLIMFYFLSVLLQELINFLE